MPPKKPDKIKHPYNNSAKFWQDKSKLAEYVGLSNTDQLDAWMQGPLVQPYWDAYLQQSLQPQRTASQSAKRGSKKRGSEFSRLLVELDAGQADGKARYSSTETDRSDWGTLQFETKLLYDLHSANTNNNNAPFYAHELQRNDELQRLFYVIRRLVWESSSSRKKKKPSVATAGPAPTAADAPTTSEAAGEAENPGAEAIIGPNPGKMTVQIDKEYDMPPELSGKIEPDEIFENVIARFPTLEDLKQAINKEFDLAQHGYEVDTVTDFSGHDEAGLADHNFEDFRSRVSNATTRSYGSIYFTVQPLLPADPLGSQSGQSRHDIFEVDATSNEPSAQAETEYRLMCREGHVGEAQTDAQKHPQNNRYHRYHMLVDVSTREGTAPDAGGEPSYTQEAAEDVHRKNKDYARWLLAKKRQGDWDTGEGEEANPTALAQADNYAARFKEPPENFPDNTAEQEEIYRLLDQALDNVELQRENVEEAYEKLGIKNKDRPHMDGMRDSQRLNFWQPLATAALLEMEDNPVVPDMRSTMLCDQVGLGKTVEAICMVAHRRNLRRQSQDALAEFGPPKPTLFVTQAHLMNQVVQDIDKFFKDIKPLIYHDNVQRPTHVQGKLHKDHPVFDPDDEDTASLVIVTSYPTMQTRHGPSSFRQHLKQKGAKQAEYSKNFDLRDVPDDTDWPSYLGGCFIRVVCDESHQLGNVETGTVKAIYWVKPKYKTLITGTPLAPKINAILGQVALMQPDHPHQSVADGDPWDLPHGHPDFNHRYTAYSLQKYIIDESAGLESSERGRRLCEFMSKFMIRRSTASQVPFNSGKCIGDEMPAVRTMVIHCRLEETELQLYQRLIKDTENKKIAKRIRNETPDLWTPAFRKLTLICASLLFEHWLQYKVDTVLEAELKRKSAHDLLVEYAESYQRREELNATTGELPIDISDIIDLVDVPEPHETKKILTYHAFGSPKLRYAMFIVAELVVLKQEKLTIWCRNPATQLWLASVFRSVGVKAEAYLASMSVKEKNDLTRKFNNRASTECQVLVMPYRGGGCGLNLQRGGHTCILFDFENPHLEAQAIGRHRRLGQPYTVRVFRLYLKDCWDSKMANQWIRASLASFMTVLNPVWFADKSEDTEPNSLVTMRITEDAHLVRPGDPGYDEADEELDSDRALMILQKIYMGHVSPDMLKTIGQSVPEVTESTSSRAPTDHGSPRAPQSKRLKSSDEFDGLDLRPEALEACQIVAKFWHAYFELPDSDSRNKVAILKELRDVSRSPALSGSGPNWQKQAQAIHEKLQIGDLVGDGVLGEGRKIAEEIDDLWMSKMYWNTRPSV